MATVRIATRVNGQRRLDVLAAKMHAIAAGGFQRKLDSKLRQRGRPIVAQLRRAALAIPSKQPKPVLRPGIAAGTRVDPRVGGIRFSVTSRALPQNKAVVPALMEGPGGWFHPTFGHAPTVAQGSHPWFVRTILANEPVLRNGIEEAIDEIADML